jgi:hypothetical protein
VHTLLVYGPTDRADAALRAAALRADTLTVVSLVSEEPTRTARRCNIQSDLWNEISHELAGRDLTRAWMTLDGDDSVRLEAIGSDRWHPADTLAAEALARGADEIVLADPGACGLGRLERRRLRRRSPLPVSAG